MPDRARFNQARRTLSASHETGTSLCAPFVKVLPVSGAALSILAGPAGQSTVCASDETAARLDELQFDLGEGPCWQAMTSREPVIEPDMRTHDRGAWPVFAQAVRAEPLGDDVRAMFAFPLRVGSLDIGALDLYAALPGELSKIHLADARELAQIAAWQVLRKIIAADAAPFDGEIGDDNPALSRRIVHQATGMVLAQLAISPADAALLLRAHAFSTGRPVRDIAHDVVDRVLDFSTPSDESGYRSGPER